MNSFGKSDVIDRRVVLPENRVNTDPIYKFVSGVEVDSVLFGLKIKNKNMRLQVGDGVRG